MSDRIKNDDSLLQRALSEIIRNPVIIVEESESGGYQYRVFLKAGDPDVLDPRFGGILLSDLLDHMAATYQAATGRDQRALRSEIFAVMKRENGLKERDPARYTARGAALLPRKN